MTVKAALWKLDLLKQIVCADNGTEHLHQMARMWSLEMHESVAAVGSK